MTKQVKSSKTYLIQKYITLFYTNNWTLHNYS